MIRLRPKFRAYFWLNLLPAELWCGRGAICSVQNHWTPYSIHCKILLNLGYCSIRPVPQQYPSTVSLGGLNTAGGGYRRSQHKSGSESGLPLSRVHKLRITRSWSNCDKPQISRFLHVSPKEDTITMIWVLVYDVRQSHRYCDKPEIKMLLHVPPKLVSSPGHH